MTTTPRSTSGSASRAFRNRAFCASRRQTISGRWAILARAAPVPRSSSIMARRFPAARRARRVADADGDRFIEIWNLVFMQFEALPGGERLSLPRPSIDTGMGLERVAAVLQGKPDNYDIDLMGAVIRAGPAEPP